LVLELTNVNGHVRGLRRQWFDDGKPRKIEWVAENEREGAGVEYRASGQLAALRCGPKPLLAPHVNDARLCGFEGGPSTVMLYSFKGDLRSTVVWVAGIEQKATTFYANGKPESEEELLQQGTQKRETSYFDDGGKRRLKTPQHLRSPVQDGVHAVYAGIVFASGHLGQRNGFAHTLRLVGGQVQGFELEHLGAALAVGLDVMHRKIHQHPLRLVRCCWSRQRPPPACRQ
jgi:hypothetical protein